MAVELLENSDREYSLEFDEQEEPQLSKNSSEILKVRHVKVCDSSTAKSKGGADCNAAEPKHRTVQKSKTESTPRTFTDSLQLRNAVYGEWLAKKSSAMKDAQRSIKEEQMKTEIALQRSAVSSCCTSVFVAVLHLKTSGMLTQYIIDHCTITVYW